MKKTMFLMVSVLLLSGVCVQLSAQEKKIKKKPDVAVEEYSRQFAEKEREALEFLREISPEKVEKLLMVKEVNRDEYNYQLKRVLEEMMQARRFEKSDPERYERIVRTKSLEEKSQSLGRAHRQASKSEKANIEAELNKILSELFDLREENRREEVAKLETRLKELKDSLKERQENKAEIIKRRLAQLTGQGQHLEWE